MKTDPRAAACEQVQTGAAAGAIPLGRTNGGLTWLNGGGGQTHVGPTVHGPSSGWAEARRKVRSDAETSGILAERLSARIPAA